jgi:hypothetical protein
MYMPSAQLQLEGQPQDSRSKNQLFIMAMMGDNIEVDPNVVCILVEALVLAVCADASHRSLPMTPTMQAWGSIPTPPVFHPRSMNTSSKTVDISIQDTQFAKSES